MLTFFAFLMKFADISKLHSKRCCSQDVACNNSNNNSNNNNNNNNDCWQHVAATSTHRKASNANSSSTSSGCDSNASSTKENLYVETEEHQQHHSITPQQLEQIRYYQHLQQQQMLLLQHQMLQRRRVQQHLREQGVPVRRNGSGGGQKHRAAPTSATLTCNQQYLLQQRLQQQQQQQLQHQHVAGNDNDYLNNNNNNNNNSNFNYNYNYNGVPKGQKSRRGMTEFSTNNDINNKSHLSQPLQNSSRHFHHHTLQHQNSPQHFVNLNKRLTHTLQQQQQHLQTHNNKNNQHTIPLNSSANINKTIPTTPITSSSAASISSSAIHSPLHNYKNPFNSPNSSPYTTYAYYGDSSGGVGDQQHQQQRVPRKPSASAAAAAATVTATTAAQRQQLQQYLRGNKLQLPYQQHLNDLLSQQQHLQQQQHQLLLNSKDADDELSEESLKHNVAIVLNNLDRYNNALRSVILNEQVSSNSSVFFDDSLLVGSNSNANNNFLAMAAPATPESDYNSNATTPGSRCNMLPFDSNLLQPQQHVVGFVSAAAGGGGCGGGGLVGNNLGGGNNLNCSLASSHDFTHDNSDYQWFLDYGYRDGCGGLQRSVLSSLSTSFNGIGDLIYYEDLAKNLDANLAEVDMESFRAEDIHSLLSQLPSYCKSLGGSNRLQQSLLLQQQTLPATTHHGQHMSQTSTTSTNELIDNSICKSELLFSPVKESHLSVDSLDMDAYAEDGDIILTCKANKDNYTIAFEGSVLYSDESFYAEPNEIAKRNNQNFINLHSNLDDIVKRKALEVSMSRSEQAFTGRGKLHKSSTIQLQRYPSGNNNTSEAVAIIRHHAALCSVRKSSSLPNLRESKDTTTCCAQTLQGGRPHQLPRAIIAPAASNPTVDTCRAAHMLPNCPLPISSNSTSVSISERALSPTSQQTQLRTRHRCSCSNSSSAANANSHNSCTQQHKHSHSSGSHSSGHSNPPAFNLVKLFIKQKSSNCSTEEPEQGSVHTCMDVSSGCWPSSDAAGSSSSSSLEQRLRKKSMNDSGKGSALSRHEEENDLCIREPGDEDDCAFRMNAGAEHATALKQHLRTQNDTGYEEDHSSGSTGSLTVTNSPAHRRRSAPLRNPQLCQLAMPHHYGSSEGSSLSSDASRSNSEQLTQVYLSSGTANSGVTLEQKKARRAELHRPPSTASSSEMITRSMQTSCGSLSTRSSLSDRFRCVPPSFLSKLNTLGNECQAPIYVIYPNYALPDLGFVKTNTSADMIFSPFNYKMAVGGAETAASLKKRLSTGDETEILKTMDYKHVSDWQSLATLLPVEYRRRLNHIPEVNKLMRELNSELVHRPLFCMTPPVRRNRPHICDCAQYFQEPQQQTQTALHSGEEGNSSSGSSHQPSSGYRGSSTLLTDSELENADPLKAMYVYQYEQQRMDSGVDMSPSAARTPPQPMPRGILRKTAQSAARTKRNSMIEQQPTQLTKVEKRRSLQEPPHPYVPGSSEELCEVFEEEAAELQQPRKERLSRKDLDARTRAENFLTSLPRSELKYYAEIAAILESSEHQVEYDAAALKKEVSRVLSQQKKVSFNDDDNRDGAEFAVRPQLLLDSDKRHKRFSTPPNSPNISMAVGCGGGLRLTNNTMPRRCSQMDAHHRTERSKPTTLDEKEQRRMESNRFKRLKIQWELMSKDSSMLKELASGHQTKSGGSTPTSAPAPAQSRIPRPVSYPAGKNTPTQTPNSDRKSLKTKTCVLPQNARLSTQGATGGKIVAPRSSRIVPPKRYSMANSPGAVEALTSPPSTGTTPTAATAIRARTPTSRTPVTAPTTPKRRVQSPRTIPRVR